MAASSASADAEVCGGVRGDGDAPAVDRACEFDAAAAAEAEAEAKQREEARRAAEAHEARVVMAEAQLNRIWKSTGLTIERIVANATAEPAAGDAGAGDAKLTRQLKTLESIFSEEPHLVPGGGAASRKRAGRGAGGRQPREADAHRYGAVQCVDVREDVYPVAPAQLQRARELECPERRLGIFRASAQAFKQQNKQMRRSPPSRAAGLAAASEPGPALRHAPGPSALVR